MQAAVKKPSPFEGMRQFFRHVMAELKKVNWPSWKELRIYTIVVIITVLAVSVIISTWDLVITQIFKTLGFYRL